MRRVSVRVSEKERERDCGPWVTGGAVVGHRQTEGDGNDSLVGVRLGEYLDHTNAAIPFPLSNTERKRGQTKGTQTIANTVPHAGVKTCFSFPHRVLLMSCSNAHETRVTYPRARYTEYFHMRDGPLTVSVSGHGSLLTKGETT
jgi:hypothetical protein